MLSAGSEKDRLKAIFSFFYDSEGHADLWTLLDTAVGAVGAATPAASSGTSAPAKSHFITHSRLLSAEALVGSS